MTKGKKSKGAPCSWLLGFRRHHGIGGASLRFACGGVQKVQRITDANFTAFAVFAPSRRKRSNLLS